MRRYLMRTYTSIFLLIVCEYTTANLDTIRRKTHISYARNDNWPTNINMTFTIRLNIFGYGLRLKTNLFNAKDHLRSSSITSSYQEQSSWLLVSVWLVSSWIFKNPLSYPLVWKNWIASPILEKRKGNPKDS